MVSFVGLVSIACFVLLVFGEDLGELSRRYKHRKFEKNKSKTEVEAKGPDVEGPNVHQVIKHAYLALPEANRPSYDLDAVLRALIVKYGFGNIDGHYPCYGGTVNVRCQCHSYRTPGKTSKDIAKSCPMPEQMRLLTGILKVQKALDKQAAAEAAREREIELAGIENDLATLDDIVSAMDNEHDAISQSTQELRIK